MQPLQMLQAQARSIHLQSLQTLHTLRMLQTLQLCACSGPFPSKKERPLLASAARSSPFVEDSVSNLLERDHGHGGEQVGQRGRPAC